MEITAGIVLELPEIERLQVQQFRRYLIYPGKVLLVAVIFVQLGRGSEIGAVFAGFAERLLVKPLPGFFRNAFGS